MAIINLSPKQAKSLKEALQILEELTQLTKKDVRGNRPCLSIIPKRSSP